MNLFSNLSTAADIFDACKEIISQELLRLNPDFSPGLIVGDACLGDIVVNSSATPADGMAIFKKIEDYFGKEYFQGLGSPLRTTMSAIVDCVCKKLNIKSPVISRIGHTVISHTPW